MKKELTAQIMDVLNQYQICYSEKGIRTNLECYSRNKRGLVALLRKHPSWNEDAMAVILGVTAVREIDQLVISECCQQLCTIAECLTQINSADFNLFGHFLPKLLHYPQKLLRKNEALRQSMEQQCGFQYIAGQKTSKAVNKFCRQYKLHEHSDYDAVFAKLADALNPLEIPRKAVLSVHPCDYLQMSGQYNSWSSCHGLPSGDYCGGTLSYMNDPVSMVFYTIDEGNEDRCLYDRPKITRTMFFYQNGVLLQSRLYPNDSDTITRDLHRRCVQGILAGCLNKPNLWRLDSAQRDMDKYIHTIHKHLHYADYKEGFNVNLSFLKAQSMYSSMVIGHNGFCFYCGLSLQHGDHKVVCRNCARLIRCAECGSVVEGSYAKIIEGKTYCRLCIDTCDQCHQDTALSSLHSVHLSSTEELHVCGGCRERDYFQCAACGEYHSNADQNKQDGQLYCPACFSGLNQQQSGGDNVVALPEPMRRAS